MVYHLIYRSVEGRSMYRRLDKFVLEVRSKKIQLRIDKTHEHRKNHPSDERFRSQVAWVRHNSDLNTKKISIDNKKNLVMNLFFANLAEHNSNHKACRKDIVYEKKCNQNLDDICANIVVRVPQPLLCLFDMRNLFQMWMKVFILINVFEILNQRLESFRKKSKEEIDFWFMTFDCNPHLVNVQ